MLKYHQSVFKSSLYLSNYKSNFGDSEKILKGSLKQEESLHVRNPLIAMIGISEYVKGVFPNLECVINDYKNVEFAFHVTRGYSMIHFDKNNQIVHKKQNYNDNDDSKSNVSSRDTFKLRWNEEEIFDFNNKISDIIKSRKNNYDGLIYFISCHGDTGGVIYDSKGEKIPLITIFDKFNNQNCIKLRNKPKIYFIEACRGQMRTKRIENSLFDEYNNNNGNEVKTKVGDEDEVKTNGTHTKNNTVIVNTISSPLVVAQSHTVVACTPPPLELEANTMANDNDSHPASCKINVKQSSNIIFSKYNYNREIYANTDGYAVVEPGSKGAYMTRSITQVIVNNNLFIKDFDEIMIHTRKIMLKLMGISSSCGAQVIDDHSNIPRKVFFK